MGSKPFTEDDIKFILENKETMTNKELAKALNVPVETLKTRTKKLGIKRDRFKQSVNNLSGEQWRPLAEAPRYEISNLGRVKDTRENFIKRASKRKDTGYMQINITLPNGKDVPRRLNRLVAITWIPNPDNKPEVNHIDGNKENNSVANLEWVTSSENKKHACDNGLMNPPKLKGENTSNASITELQAKQIIQLLKEGKSYSEINEITGINKNIIGQIKRCKTWTHLER